MTTTKTMCTYANKFDQLIMQVKFNRKNDEGKRNYFLNKNNFL